MYPACLFRLYEERVLRVACTGRIVNILEVIYLGIYCYTYIVV